MSQNEVRERPDRKTMVRKIRELSEIVKGSTMKRNVMMQNSYQKLKTK